MEVTESDLYLKDPNIVHGFLMTVRKMSSACDLVAEILLIIWGQALDMYVQRNVLRFCTGSISGWNRTGRIGPATGDSRAM